MKTRKVLRNNNHRRLMFKRTHQRMLHRRRQFVTSDLLATVQSAP
ncbi:hypothetical protein [Salinimonas sediminis]|nr:hypothetical protein [Salinimonas sediminis]